jgi:quinol monooxygenase YgiN
MAQQTVRFTVDLTIHEGKLNEFQSIAQAMIADTEKEPGTLAYDWCLSADRKRCRLVEAYVDANAVLAHMTGPVVQKLVPKLVEVTAVSAFEVYGDPGPQATAMLTGMGAEIFPLWRGLDR